MPLTFSRISIDLVMIVNGLLTGIFLSRIACLMVRIKEFKTSVSGSMDIINIYIEIYYVEYTKNEISQAINRGIIGIVGGV